VRRLIAAIRENDERKVEEAILQLARSRRTFAPLALAAGAFVMLFSGLRLLVTNWRLMLVQALPAMWIWAVTVDLKAHVLRGRAFDFIHGPIVLVLFAAVVLITIAAFYLNAAFAFAISQPGSPDLRAGFHQARTHVRAVTGWGTGIGLALAVAITLAPRWGLAWFALLLGIVLAVMMLCYVAVPARIVGLRTAKPARTAQSGHGAKLAAAAVTGLFGAIVCAPPYAIARGGIVLLGSSALFPLGVALLIIGLMLEAGATGAVKAIKVSAKLLAGRSPDTPDDRESSGLDGAEPSSVRTAIPADRPPSARSSYGGLKLVANQVTTAPGRSRHSATYTCMGIALTCGDPTQRRHRGQPASGAFRGRAGEYIGLPLAGMFGGKLAFRVDGGGPWHRRAGGPGRDEERRLIRWLRWYRRFPGFAQAGDELVGYGGLAPVGPAGSPP